MAAIPDWQEPFRHEVGQGVCAVESVVLPLDGSEVAKTALGVARSLARLYRATLHIVYVGERLLGPKQTLQELGISAGELRGAVLDQVTGDPAPSIRALLPDLPVPLLVMSTHTGNEPHEALIGEVGDALLNSDLDRVILVAPELGSRSWEPRRVLLAHDGSRTTDVATAQAADIAHRAGADVLAIHVAARNASAPVAPGSMPAPRYLDQPQHEWPAWANEFLDRMIALGAPPAKVRFKLMVTGGQPGSEIADFARENHADLVVAAWHGAWHEEQEGALSTIIRRSGCPVMLVHSSAVSRVRKEA